MKLNLSFVPAALLFGLSMGVYAHDDERPDHFEGEASETLEEAQARFAETNRRIADILAQDEVTMLDMAEIHKLTYTLENAIERIDQEYDRLEEQLEALHLASEGADVARVRSLADTYLKNAGRF